MSIGFTVPFLNLISKSFAGMEQVGILTAAFGMSTFPSILNPCASNTTLSSTNIHVTLREKVVTGILNAILVYAVAYHVQLWTTKTVARWTRFREGKGEGAHGASRRDRPVLDDNNVEDSARFDNNTNFCTFHHQQQHQQTSSCPPRSAAPSSTEICCGGGHDNDAYGDRDITCQSCLERFRKHISDVSTLCTLSGYTSDSNGPNATYLEEGRGEGRGLGAGPGRERPADALWALENDRFSFAGRDGPQVSVSEARCCGLLGTTRALARWIQRNIFLTFSILLLLLVGLPLSCLRHEDLFLDIGFVFTVWLTFASAQTRVKQHTTRQDTHHDNKHHHDDHYHHHETPRPLRHLRHRKSLTVLAALLNPVLWTSLFLLCYGLTKSRIRNTSTATIVAQFKTGNTISDLIAHHIDVSNLSSAPASASASSSSSNNNNNNNIIIPFGAGDLATSILNAGIVSWGLKLFEYRAHLLSRGGLTALLTTAAMALFNVVVWPVLVASMGVRPSASALSFAARSVTIALGGPAMESIGGDAGINAVGVVVNGICFQLVAGLLVLVGEGCDVVEEEEGSGGLRGRLVGWWTATVMTFRGREHDRKHHPRCSLSQPEGSSDATHTEEKEQQQQQLQDGATRASLKSDQQDETVQTPSSLSSSSRSSPVPALHNNTDISSISDRHHDLEAGSPPRNPAHHHYQLDDDSSTITSDASTSRTTTTSTTTVVANGITIGINAAAMGTSHLYEQNSPAAAYSALSMTTFGVFTVLFTVQSPLTAWLIGMVGG